MELDRAAVRPSLGLGDPFDVWLAELEAAGAPARSVCLPGRDEAASLLARLAVPDEDAAEVLEALPSRQSEPEVWWLLDRCCHLLLRDMGGFDSMGKWPSLPPELGVLGRYFYVYVFLAALPAVRQWHQARGIPDEISWATLADLGRNVGIHRRIHDVGGLDAQGWLTLHFRGGIYHLGRLQFNRGRIWWDDATLEALGADFRRGDPALGIHIPESGPLTPEVCDDSFRQAVEFFPRYFPEESYRLATCGSWLLDEQLAEYLAETSNIVRFQRRFHMLPADGRNSDATVLMFVFRRIGPSLDELSQRTALERAVVQHMRAGRHWQSRFGWLSLEAAASTGENP